MDSECLEIKYYNELKSGILTFSKLKSEFTFSPKDTNRNIIICGMVNEELRYNFSLILSPQIGGSKFKIPHNFFSVIFILL